MPSLKPSSFSIVSLYFHLNAGAAVHRSDSQDNVTIYLLPHVIKVQSGDTFTLTCDFHMVQNVFMVHASWVKVTWMFSRNSNTSEPPKLPTSQDENSHFQQRDTENQSMLKVRNAYANDSGWYSCKVCLERPTLRDFSSSQCNVIIGKFLQTKSNGNT